MVAGDAMGDRLGAALIEGLRQRLPGVRFVGVAGPNMQAAGAEATIAMEKLVPKGRQSRLGRARRAGEIRQALTQRILEARPALFAGIGAPELNLALARSLRRAGVPTLQYAGPAVWTWRGWRLRSLARRLSHVLALYPFEAETYARAGIPVTYVGHPLADRVPIDVDKAAARTQLRLPHGKLIVALMPGDRWVGLPQIAEAFFKAARRFYNEVSDVHFVVPAFSRRSRELFESTLRAHADGDLPLTLLFGHSHDALAAADLALVASETASLEALLFKTPMVVARRTATAMHGWWRRLSIRPFRSLPNRLAGELLVTELIQRQVTPWGLAGALMALMRDAQARRHQSERFSDIHRVLRQDNVAKASEAIGKLIGHGHG